MSAILHKQGQRFSETEWETNNNRTAVASNSSVSHSSQLRGDAGHLVNSTCVQTHWDQFDSNERLCRRIQEVQHWQATLQRSLVELDDELKLLASGRSRVQEQLELRFLQLEACLEALTVRERRSGVDVVGDRPEQLLNEEVETLKLTRKELQQLVNNFDEQHQFLLSARQQLATDVQQMYRSLDIDTRTLSTTSQGACLSRKPNSHRLPVQLCSVQYWEGELAAHRVSANRQMCRSKQMRRRAADKLAELVVQLTRAHEATATAFRRRSHEIESAIDELMCQQRSLSVELQRVECQYRTTGSTLQDSKRFRQLTETRLEHRLTKPPHTQLTYDAAWHGLLQQRQHTMTAGQQLDKSSHQLRAASDCLAKQLSRVDQLLSNRRTTLETDQLSAAVHARAVQSAGAADDCHQNAHCQRALLVKNQATVCQQVADSIPSFMSATHRAAVNTDCKAIDSDNKFCVE